MAGMVYSTKNDSGMPKRNVLIVEDNDVNREMLHAILANEFNVLEAKDGLEGLDQLRRNYGSLSLVLLDVYMPRCDGFEFLRQKRMDERFDSVPVIVTTASDLCEDEIECLRLGANDFVVKPYNVEIIVNRVNNIIRLRESASIVNQLTWDNLTELYSSEFFYRHMHDFLSNSQTGAYDMVCSEITNFKALSDRYGKGNCDRMLQELAKRLNFTLPNVVAGGRIANSTFAFLIEHQNNRDWTNTLMNVSHGLIATNMSLKFGIVENVDHGLAVSLTCDRAVIALEQVRETFGVSVAWYTEDLHAKQVREQVIVETMEQALAEKQFIVYYQPKYDLHTGQTGGAEALVRWIHPELGFVRPDFFIPLFERNGFITNLDYYVLEEACKEIVRCRENGLHVVPISVNVSRLDFDTEDLAQQIAHIADSHGVDHSLLHIEITETAYIDNPDLVVAALQELKDNGFIIELDDFGAGYSSLASLNMLPLDVMKLDMSIIRQAASLDDYRIVRSAIQMAGFLGLKTVAEGVETEEETKQLKELGCDMIQGYYFAKPLEQREFEEYVS